MCHNLRVAQTILDSVLDIACAIPKLCHESISLAANKPEDTKDLLANVDIEIQRIKGFKRTAHALHEQAEGTSQLVSSITMPNTYSLTIIAAQTSRVPQGRLAERPHCSPAKHGTGSECSERQSARTDGENKQGFTVCQDLDIRRHDVPARQLDCREYRPCPQLISTRSSSNQVCPP